MLTLCLSLFLGSFVSEDGSLLTALALAKDTKLPLLIACLASGLGIFVGDLGLYIIGRSAQSWPIASKYTQRILSSHYFRPGYADSKWGYGAVFIARFIPGTRLPIYLIAGVCKMSFWTFFFTTAIAVLTWTALITTASAYVFQFLNPSQTWILVCGTIAFIFALLFLSQKENFQVKLYRLQKLKHFEFWPMWIFYWPVVIYYIIQGLKYRNFRLPLYANPGISNSGVVGESKAEILQHMIQDSPYTLKNRLIHLDSLSLDQAITELQSFLKNEELDFPIIIKPDVGQRGSGVRVIRALSEASAYFACCKVPLLIQEFCPYSEELGVNYVRYPGEERGRITGITRKRFPHVTGDGKRTLRELILDDARAKLIAEIYFDRHSDKLESVLPQESTLKLVESGNHCQGCIFEDGKSLMTNTFERSIDEIAHKIPGFYVGRFDIRFSSEATLKEGKDFKIIEINGAAGEATHIYDSKMKLWEAYKILFEQIKVLFKVGSMNQKEPIQTNIIQALRSYRKLSKLHPPTT